MSEVMQTVCHVARYDSVGVVVVDRLGSICCGPSAESRWLSRGTRKECVDTRDALYSTWVIRLAQDEQAVRKSA